MGNYHIRTSVEPDKIFLREGKVNSDLAKIKKGLKKLHSFEIMAVNIYRLQITNNPKSINTMIIQAMANEMTHVQDFQTKLYEYGGRPSPWRFAFYIAGSIIGLFSRLLGDATILKTGIWTETKAVNDYNKIINSVQWEKDVLDIIKHNLDDEYHHIEILKQKLQSLNTK